VEVAPVPAGEGRGFAAGSVGLDVSAAWCLHECLPGGSPLLLAYKLNGCNILAKAMSAKILQPKGLLPNYCQ
jgi:hypothetical protein